MKYPLVMTVPDGEPQSSIVDSNDELVLNLAAHELTVFADHEMEEPVYAVAADNILDFSEQYHFIDRDGQVLGSLRIGTEEHRILNGPGSGLLVRDRRPGWVDNLPLFGDLAGVLLRSGYRVDRGDGEPVMSVESRLSRADRVFCIQKQAELDPDEEARVLLSLMVLMTQPAD